MVDGASDDADVLEWLLVLMNNSMWTFFWIYFIRQIEWLNEFHQRIRDQVVPLLRDDEDVIEWLMKETEPIQFKHNGNNEYNELDIWHL